MRAGPRDNFGTIDRHGAVEPRVTCAIPLPQAARTKRNTDLVGTQFPPRGEAHFFFNSASQFTTSEIGSGAEGCNKLLSRNRRPSGETS